MVDVGKTYARFHTVDRDDRSSTVDRREIQPVGRSVHIRELDVHDIERWLIDVIRSHPERERIHTLIPMTHGAAGVLIDANRNVLVAPDYEDPCFEEVRESYRPLRDQFDLTYSPFLPLGLNLGRQLYYLQTNRPALFEQASQLLLYPQYWAWVFSGVAASELTSLGCHSDLWRPLMGAPTALAERQGWTSVLPPLRAAGDCLGTVSPSIARLTGLNRQCRVLCGLHDSNASFLAHLPPRSDKSFAVVSSGTWTIVMAKGVNLGRVREPLDMLVNVDALGGPVASARFMGGREYEIVAGDPGKWELPAIEEVETLLGAAAFALPSFSSAGGPFAALNGRLVGAETLTARQRATLGSLYVALMTDTLLRLLRVEGEIIVDGPLARNSVYLHILARLRARNGVYITEDRTPAASAALYLTEGGIPRQNYREISKESCVPDLESYRAAWLSQFDEHTQAVS